MFGRILISLISCVRCDLRARLAFFWASYLYLPTSRNLADRRIGVGRDFDEVEADFGGLLDRFGGQHDAEILAIFIDHAHLGHGDEFVEAGAVERGRGGSPVERGTYVRFLLKAVKQRST